MSAERGMYRNLLLWLHLCGDLSKHLPVNGLNPCQCPRAEKSQREENSQRQMLKTIYDPCQMQVGAPLVATVINKAVGESVERNLHIWVSFLRCLKSREMGIQCPLHRSSFSPAFPSWANTFPIFFFFFAENKGSLQDMQIYFETADFFFYFRKDLSKDLQLILFKQLRSQPFISQKA